MTNTLNYLQLILDFFSGRSSEVKQTIDFQGTYSGTFNRYSFSNGGEPTKVSLTLRSGKFIAKSANEKYPGICRGRYIISDDEIEFRNECMWISQSDHSLVLNGKYKLFKDRNNLQLKMTLDSDSVPTIDFYNLLLQ